MFGCLLNIISSIYAVRKVTTPFFDEVFVFVEHRHDRVSTIIPFIRKSVIILAQNRDLVVLPFLKRFLCFFGFQKATLKMMLSF